MRALSILLALAFLRPGVAQAEPAFLGDWESDKKVSLKVARESLKLECWELSLMEQYFGNIELSISEDEISQRVRPFSISVPGVERDFEESTVVTKYKLLGKDEDSVAIRIQLPGTEDESILVYHFENEDLMWLYSADQPGFDDFSYRHYFRRVE